MDEQMARWSQKLVHELKVSEEASHKLATTIASEVRFLPVGAKSAIERASPVALRHRIEELQAFQAWMDDLRGKGITPPIVRAQVITQNYICFVYLPESCFTILRKSAPSGSAVRQCAKFLTDDRVRYFRNALAHANWCYRADFGAITYWARKGSEPNEPLSKFEVEQSELTFWQALSRCVAYATFTSLE
jgi:hypothetical protein